MRVCSSFLLAVLALTPTVLAAPRHRTCRAADAVYSALRGPLKAEASSFCLAYLGGDSTVTSTVSTTVTAAGRTDTTTLPDQTQTSSTDVTHTNLVTATVTTTVTAATVPVTVTVTAATKTVYQKRNQRHRRPPPPSQICNYAESRISSACSCVVTPMTTTVLTTQTQTLPGPSATQTQDGQTITVTITNTVEVTLTNTETDTVPVTATETTTATVTPILVKPKVCNARGLPGPNAFNYDANFNSNQADCLTSCKTDDRCLCTGFYLVTDPTTGDTTGTCRKYDKSVTDSADLGPGYYNFNDKAC